ncbi:MAG: DMT family transporter, partial [SAR324 cluster bacterium]|nr:DMT family transporter [SAR324 cluster bacterium]
WALWRGKRISVTDGTFKAGVLTGCLFSIEFIFLFLALDMTTVARNSIFWYSMPVWMVIGAHFLIDGERLNAQKIIGLIISMVGLVWAFSDRGLDGESGTWVGDLMSILGSMCWAGIGLSVRVSKLKEASIEMQLLYNLAVSTIVLLPFSLLFGDWIRDLQTMHVFMLGFQVVIVVAGGFLVWFWVLTIYPASDMASFGFLTPAFGVIFSWLILDEAISFTILSALVLISAGIFLINYRPKKPICIENT